MSVLQTKSNTGVLKILSYLIESGFGLRECLKMCGDGVETSIEGRGSGSEPDFGDAFEPFFLDLFLAFDVVGATAEAAGGAGELGGVV